MIKTFDEGEDGGASCHRAEGSQGG
jgi:hypothetical protein